MTPIALVFSIHWVAERVKLGMQKHETIWKQKRNQRDIWIYLAVINTLA